MTLSGNISISTHSVLSIPVSVPIAASSVIVLATHCPSIVDPLSSGRIQPLSSSGYFLSCFYSSPSLSNKRRISRAGCVTKALSSRNPYLRCQLLRTKIISRKPTSCVTTITCVDHIILVTSLHSLFMSLWCSSHNYFWLLYHILVPYKVTACTAATSIRLTSSGAGTSVTARCRTLPSALLAYSNLWFF